jgi:hypothetical protein
VGVRGSCRPSRTSATSPSPRWASTAR